MKQLSQNERIEIIDSLQEYYSDPWDPNHFNKENLLDDQQVCDILKVSVKTLRRHCKKNTIPHFKLGKRYYYFKHILYLQLLKLNTD